MATFGIFFGNRTAGVGGQTATPGAALVTVSAADAAAAASGSVTRAPGAATVTVSAAGVTGSASGTVTRAPGAAPVTVTTADVTASSGFATATPGVALAVLSAAGASALPSGAAQAAPGACSVTVGAFGVSGSGVVANAPQLAAIYGRAGNAEALTGRASGAGSIYGRAVMIEKPIGPFAVGADVAIDWTHADGEDITGMAWAFDVLDAHGGTVLAGKTSGAGITQTGDSTLRITLTSADMAAVGEGEWVYTHSRTDLGGKDVYSFGAFTVGPPKVHGT